MTYYEIFTNECSVTLEKQPTCNIRGQWVAKLHVKNHSRAEFLQSQFWPRFYFSGETAKDEVEAFLKASELTIVKDWDIYHP